MEIQAAVDRLNAQLPLKARQDRLPSKLKAVHQCVLTSLVNKGRPPTIEELQGILGEGMVSEGLQRLSSDDLVVLDDDGKEPVGAYLVTIEQTPV